MSYCLTLVPGPVDNQHFSNWESELLSIWVLKACLEMSTQMVEGGMGGSWDRSQMPTPGLDSQSQRQLRKCSRVRVSVFLTILYGALLWLPQLHFLAYQESRESNWSPLVSLRPLAGRESNPAPHFHLLLVLPPGGLTVTTLTFHPRARGFQKPSGAKPTLVD